MKSAYGKPDLTDIGHGVGIRLWRGSADGPTEGLVWEHPDQRDGSRRCTGGSLTFAGHGWPEPNWTVESLEPLTLSPSLLCRVCGCHGFIREGRWVPA